MRYLLVVARTHFQTLSESANLVKSMAMRFVMLNWRDPENPRAGGAERVTLGYLRALVERGHRVDWLTHSYPGCEPGTTIDGIRIHRLGGLVASRFRAREWLRTNHPVDLVIDQHHGIPWFSPFLTRAHSISYIHEVLGPIWKSFYPFPAAQIGMMQERLILSLYRGHPFWTGCQSTRIQLEEIGVRRIRVIRYGVDWPPLEALPEKIPGDPLKLVMVSRLAPNKRVDHGPKLLRQLIDIGIDARLTILGDGECRPSILEQIESLKLTGKCSAEGYVPEDRKRKVLTEAHLLVHTSVREGWGLNVIEANACGTPAVVYPVPGLVDSTQNLVTGWVAANESPEALASIIRELIRKPDQYQTIRHQAHQESLKYQWNAVLPEATSFLESMAHNK
jgi:glycosyltransferase involved in cell wall biosynthesis